MAFSVPAASEPTEARARRIFADLLELQRRIDSEIDDTEALARVYRKTLSTVVGRYKKWAGSDNIRRKNGLFSLDTANFNELSQATKEGLAEAEDVLPELGNQLRRNLDRIYDFTDEQFEAFGRYELRKELGALGRAAKDATSRVDPAIVEQLKGSWPADGEAGVSVGEPGVVGRFFKMSLDHRQRLADTFTRQVVGRGTRESLAKALAKELETAEWQAAALLRDTTQQFNREVTRRQAEANGIEYFMYAGPDDAITRKFCDPKVGRVFKAATIDRMDNGQTGAGTAFTAAGGYNCRHRWVPVRPDWYGEEKWATISDEPWPGETPPPEEEAAPEPTQANSFVFPDDPNDLTFVQSLGGSTGAKLMQDELGNKFVYKTGNSPDHIRSEFVADELYRGIGVNVPESRLYETDTGPVKLARFIEGGEQLGSYFRKATAAQKQELWGQVSQGVAADVAMANWDVIGQSMDNILIDPDGVAWRIDTGGALSFRAQGAPKGGAYTNNPLEFHTFQQPGNSAEQYFGSRDKVEMFEAATDTDVLDALDEYLGKADPFVNAGLDFDESMKLRFRIDSLRDRRREYDTMVDDSFEKPYLTEFMRFRQTDEEAFETGPLKTLKMEHLARDPKRMKVPGMYEGLDQGRRGTFEVNSKQLFDNRKALSDYFDSQVSSSAKRFLKSYGRDQAGDSWKTQPRKFKYAWHNFVRTTPDSKVYFGDRNLAPNSKQTLNKSKYDLLSEKQRRELLGAIARQHAFTSTYLRRYHFGDELNSPRDDGFIRLLRTENPVVVRGNNIKAGDFKEFAKGNLESTSVFEPVYVHGSDLFVYDKVPIHRVFAAYFQRRPGNVSGGYFLGDGENEAVVDLNGLKSYYGGGRSGVLPKEFSKTSDPDTK